jgi:hypothetical protein
MYETCVCNKVVCELQAFCDVTLCVLVTGHRHFKYSRSLAFRVKHSKKSEDKLDYDISKRPWLFPSRQGGTSQNTWSSTCYILLGEIIIFKENPCLYFVSIKLFITTVAISPGSDNFREESYLATKTYRKILDYLFIYLFTTTSLANIGLSDCLPRQCTVTNGSEFA